MAPYLDGQYLFENFFFEETVPEAPIQDRVMSILQAEAKIDLGQGKVHQIESRQQIHTFDRGRLEILVYDTLSRLPLVEKDRTKLPFFCKVT